jgi:hypothetical protein
MGPGAGTINDMTEKEFLGGREHSQEEEYFRRRDRELIDKMRKAAEAAELRKQLGERAGLDDPEMVQELQDLGFTPETVELLPLMPAIQMAWAEGGVTAQERATLVSLARARGVTEDSAGDRQLHQWLDTRPDDSVFERAMRLINALLDRGTGLKLDADDLVKLSEEVALASGGILGIIGRVSREEKQLLHSLADQLKARRR